MKPYYDHGGITIYHGDSRDIILDIPRPDLLVLDPPFDLWTGVPLIDAETVVAFTTWQHRKHVETLYGTPRSEVIWNFDDGRWVSHKLPIITHETILVYGSLNEVYVGEEHDQKPRRIGSHSAMKGVKTPRSIYVPRSRRALCSVLRYPQSLGVAPLGRWSKPEGLMRTLMEWTLTGPLVVDPYMGGGTTLRVAKDLGVKAIGVEIEERFCEIAAHRLGQESLAI